MSVYSPACNLLTLHTFMQIYISVAWGTDGPKLSRYSFTPVQLKITLADVFAVTHLTYFRFDNTQNFVTVTGVTCFVALLMYWSSELKNKDE